MEDKGMSYWFVGASFGGENPDQTDRFVSEGIWENGYEDKLLDVVRAIAPGDRIAIKSTYTRRLGLPFESRGNSVSVMGIKAIGVVTKNSGDGRHIEVDWEPQFRPSREWYFFTNRKTVWRISPGEWMNDNLIEFTFNSAAQDINKFCNAPYWWERFGSERIEKQHFKWTLFYEAMADKLLVHQADRSHLMTFVLGLAERFKLSYLLGKQLDDICPFSVMGMFNRKATQANRKAIAQELADFLGVSEAVPDSFEGIPILNNQRSLFFGFEEDRDENDIENLWRFLRAAIEFADLESDDVQRRAHFSESYDAITKQYIVGWNITMGLYWIRPWHYLTLDSQSQSYIKGVLGMEIPKNGAKGRCSAGDYFRLTDELHLSFLEESFPLHSFPELSFAAFQQSSPIELVKYSGWKESITEKIIELCGKKDSTEFSRSEFLDAYLADLTEEFPSNRAPEHSANKVFQNLRDEDLLEFLKRGEYRWLGGESSIDKTEEEVEQYEPPQHAAYSVNDIVDDGCFIESEKLEMIIERLADKKNIILQGPPGTGKTWLGRRLAYALMREKDESRLKAIQFHPNLSYEDFVRGWRPTGEGRLDLVDGPFLEIVNAAKKNISKKYVVLIEEINRGNPAQIFGEMLTLIEKGKRAPQEALSLSYPGFEGERVYVPSNLHIIGTMNIADRSLALVDLAFRRRFAFIGLAPSLGDLWRNWVHKKAEIPLDALRQIEQKIIALNKIIAEDARLGPQFQVGHSYVTAESPLNGTAREWFAEVVNTEIFPLLEEYWFDDAKEAMKQRDMLLEGLD
jgi:5-methylcytosine-specific restriction protein B